MLGAEFKRIVRAAQAGDEAAFVQLWRDANPVMTRYLRVSGMDDPYDAACEGWITVVRGLPGFRGDETAWRVWLLACARIRAEESSLRRSWGSVTVLPGLRPGPGEEPIEVDDLEPTGDPEHRGIAHAIAAIRALPLGQGEVVMLRLCAGLPESAVADVVGTDVEGVRRTEARALERLDIDRDLLSWSLAAPAMPAELADERVVKGAFRSLPHTAGDGGARVIAMGARRSRRPGQQRAAGAGWSRSALVGVAAVSASVVSLGGLGAAAYTGSLPTPVQQVMHDVIGAPAPPASAPGGGSRPGPGQPGGATPTGSGHPGTSGSPTAPGKGAKGTAPTTGSPSPAGGSPADPTRARPTHPAPTPPGATRTGPTQLGTTHAPNSRTTQSGSPTAQPSGKGQARTSSPGVKDSGGATGATADTAPTPTAATVEPTSGSSSGKGATGKGSARSGATSGEAATAGAA